MDHHRVSALMDKDAVQHIQGIDGRDARDEGLFRLAVERLGGEAAGIHLAALGHECGEAFVDQKVPREGFVAQGRESPLKAERDAWPIKQDGGLVTFAQKPCGVQRIDEADGAFESDAVKGHERFLARIGLDVIKDLFFIVDQDVAIFVGGNVYCGHGLRMVGGLNEDVRSATAWAH